ncbi:AI-2E family transporter [Falsiroseomonas sp. E2-1-a20]|uniref:AI-2E family transporter n=1 Tax=Falsiroseomonas sp. E2-1-a20 TaxID=3239300 RepID=UPI003F403D61
MPKLPPIADRRVRPAGVPKDGGAIAQAALVVVAVLYFARELLVPLALAVLLSFVLAPIARALRRIGIPRVVGVLAAVLAAVAVIGMLGLVMGRQLSELATDIPIYQWELNRKLASVNASGGMLERAQEMLRGLADGAEQAAAQRPEPAAANAVPPLLVEVQAPAPRPFELLQNIIEPLLLPLATFGIVVVLVVFVLLYREDLRDRVIRLVGADDLHRTMAAMDDAAYRLSRFFLAQTAMNAAYGVVITLALLLIGVPQPVLWGILAGLMRFVPFVGTIVAVAFPLLLALAVEPGWTMPLLVLILFAIGEGLMGQVFEPLVFGHSTGLSPIAVIAAATFWTWLWGPIGLILAVPLTVCLVVLGRHVERFEFLEVALGDRPPLDPPETFYQRALAGDADALGEQAETMLRDHRLSAYYDEVALPALALAQADALRGSFAEERLVAVRARVASLVEDLEEEVEDDQAPQKPLAEPDGDDAPPPPPPDPPPAPEALAQPGAVICLAGRGPFDEAVAAMLAQVLRKRGFGAVAAPAELLRGGDLTGFEPSGVRQAWLCTVEGGASAAAARYLLRRLKRRFPDSVTAALVIGAPENRLTEALRAEGAAAVELEVGGAARTALRLLPAEAGTQQGVPAPGQALS